MAPLQLRAQAQGLTLQSRAPLAATALSFDATRLAQVLANLVGNAIKFTEHGVVRAEGRWDAATQRLQIEVEDEGPGIPEQELPDLFEPYAQGVAGRKAAAGAGLGLAITQQIVLAMGGHIAAASGRSRGALFTVSLPLEPAA
jgi:signal transduction histidine kinase